MGSFPSRETRDERRGSERAPDIDPDVTGEELDRAVRRQLTTLRAEAAEAICQHLVMAARRLEEEDHEGAYAHAVAARRRGQRVGVVREAVGLVAYRSGRYAEALAELRAARRMSGIEEHWPVMADCERALGRPERALEMAAAPEAMRLDRAGRAEMRIVAAGARSDLGQHEAAVVTLQDPDLGADRAAPWLARLRYAYAEALDRVGRTDEARHWLVKAADADLDGETDALERVHGADVAFLTDDDLLADEDLLGGEPVESGGEPVESGGETDSSDRAATEVARAEGIPGEAAQDVRGPDRLGAAGGPGLQGSG